MLDHPIARSVNLTFNVIQALKVPWLNFGKSILGQWGSLDDMPDGYEAEKAAIWPPGPDVKGALGTAVSILSPIGRGLRTPSGPIAPAVEPTGRERWFFMNGICTDPRIAALNVDMLQKIFGRPITTLYNQTSGVVGDLVECAAGKAFDAVTEAAEGNLPAFVKALCDPGVDRVVFIAHSQGSIIAAVLLKVLEEVLIEKVQVPPPKPGEKRVSPERKVAQRMMEKSSPGVDYARRHLEREYIGKLEIYAFANCATSMQPFVALGEPLQHAPWIESYGNEFDAVSKLGVLSPPHGVGSARIEGDSYVRQGAWGHLLNVHYLVPLLRDVGDLAAGLPLLPFHDNLRVVPRLYEYVHARSPLPYLVG